MKGFFATDFIKACQVRWVVSRGERRDATRFRKADSWKSEDFVRRASQAQNSLLQWSGSIGGAGESHITKPHYFAPVVVVLMVPGREDGRQE